MNERSFAFTFYPRLREPQGSRHVLSFPQIVDWLGQSSAHARKDEAPLVGPALFPGDTRRAGNVPEGAELLFLDIDAQPAAAVLNGLEQLSDKGYRLLTYTTHSHGAPEKPGACLRVIFPLDRRVSREEYRALSVWAWSQFPDVSFDTTSDQITRAFYVPSYHPSRAALRVFEQSEGREPLHVDALIARAARLAGAAPAPTVKRPFCGEIVGQHELLTLARRLQRAGIDTQGPTIGRMIENGIKGYRYASDGSRHAANVRISYVIGREFPHADAFTIAQLFSAALEQQGGKTVDEFARLIESAQRKAEVYEDWTRGLFPTKRARGPKVAITLREGGAK